MEPIRRDHPVQEEESRFRKVFEEGPLGMAVIGLDHSFLQINAQFSAMLGYDGDELKGETFHGVTHPDDLRFDLSFIAKLMAGEIPHYTIQKRYLKKQGEIIWGKLTASLLRDEENMPLYFLAMVEDITSRIEANFALQNTNDRLQTLREIDQAILAAHSSRTVAEAVVQRISQLLPCHRATVSLYDQELHKLVLLASYSELMVSKLSLAVDLPVEFDFHAERDGCENVREYADLRALQSPPSWISKLLSEGIRSGLLVPLTVRGDLVGSLRIWCRDRNSFSHEHREIAREVADSLAVAIAQANLHQQLLESSESLQFISRRLVEVQEVERRNLARELHDQIGQDLTALKIALEMGARGVSNADDAWPKCQSLVNDLMSRVRQLSFDLRPAMLDDLGLIPALVWHFERYTSQTEIIVTFKHTGAERRFEPQLETAAYRIVQEALTNVARHAEVQEVVVRLWADGEVVGVQIEDEGKGFLTQNEILGGKSLGLAAMRERALLLQGSLTVESTPGEGTRVTAEIPAARLTSLPLFHEHPDACDNAGSSG